MIRIGINGFGRIGRAIAKINALNDRFQLVAINDIDPSPANLAYLLKYDSTYGRCSFPVEHDENSITINGHKALYSGKRQLLDIDWQKLNVDILIESSGVHESVKDAAKLIREGLIKAAVVTHSTSLVDKEVIMGINENKITEEDKLISNSICDANALAHILKWLDESYEIKNGAVTTLHPWLAYQNLVDGPSISESVPGCIWRDQALGRASINNLIPKNTSAVTAVERVLPQISGKLMSFSYRTPTDIVASSDITVSVKKPVTEDTVRAMIKEKAQNNSYISINNESLVSCDYLQLPFSAIIDMQWLKVNQDMIKIVIWYDNEWGYSHRALDLVEYLAAKFVPKG